MMQQISLKSKKKKKMNLFLLDLIFFLILFYFSVFALSGFLYHSYFLTELQPSESEVNLSVVVTMRLCKQTI